MSKNIAIFALANGVGISRDITIIKEILEKEGHKISIINPFLTTSKKGNYDLSIFLERFSQNFLDCSPVNIIIPNQEWFELNWMQFLGHFSCIFAKTKYAEGIFKNLGCETEYIGFTSEDRYLKDVKKDYNQWLHVAGKSVQKQTDLLWQTWEKNPSFPNLFIVQDPKFFQPKPSLRNVVYAFTRFPDDLLKYLQNSCGVHVCPSITEGFGHYINEAMSCKSLVISTNAAPMTEFITAENGVLLEPIRQEKMRLSISNITSIENIEKSVIKAMVMDDSQKEDMGEKCRQRYVNADEMFKKTFLEKVNKYLL